MANDLWRWADPNGQQRTVRLDELRSSLASGLIAPNTPVWKPGWDGWQSAHEVPELSGSAAAAANGVTLNIPPPPLAMVAVQKDYERTAAPSFAPQAPSGGGAEPPPPPAYVPAPVAQSVTGTGPHSSQSSQSGVALPTTIGLPPPPELQAMMAKAKGPLLPVPGESSPSRDPMIEELSGSVLLDEDRSSAAMNGLPPPTAPTLENLPETDDLDEEELKSLKAKNPLETVLFDLREIKQGRPPKNKPKLVVAGILVGAVLLIVLAVFVSIVKSIFGGGDDKTAKTSPSASASGKTPPVASTSTTASVSTSAISTAIPPPPPPSTSSGPVLGDCTMSGEAKSLGWRAIVAGGLEALPIPNAVAVSFASGPRDGIALAVDPANLTTSTSARARSLGGDVRRVSPVLVGGKLAVAVDADRKGDKLTLRRAVAATSPIDLGVNENQLVWAPHGKDSWAKLSALEGDSPVEALRGIPLAGDKGIAFAFRRSGAIYVGTAKGDATLTADGNPQRIAGLGQVGSPALAISGDNVVVAWADRASADANWQVRWTTMKPGSTPADPKTFTIPDGGLGGQAMSPSIAGLGGGRFLIAWTEGPVSNHQVRAITLGADGAPSGAALKISAEGVNAGQPAVGVGADGRGLVSFLAAKGKGYEVHAVSISCAAK